MVRRYIQPKRGLRASKQTVRYETVPGGVLQHDWGQIRIEMGGGRLCAVNFAVNIFGYSRHFHACAGPSQDAEHNYESLVQAFRYFDGMPIRILVDNQKAAAIRHESGRAIFSAGFLELANHYGYILPEPGGHNAPEPRAMPSVWWAMFSASGADRHYAA